MFSISIKYDDRPIEREREFIGNNTLYHSKLIFENFPTKNNNKCGHSVAWNISEFGFQGLGFRVIIQGWRPECGH